MEEEKKKEFSFEIKRLDHDYKGIPQYSAKMKIGEDFLYEQKGSLKMVAFIFDSTTNKCFTNFLQSLGLIDKK